MCGWVGCVVVVGRSVSCVFLLSVIALHVFVVLRVNV